MEVVRSGPVDQESSEVERTARRICAAVGNDPAALIEVLHEVRREHGDLPELALATIADALNLSRAEVYGTKSFYADFRGSVSEHRLHICLGEACRARGAGRLFDAAQARLAETGGSPAIAAYCLGNCALGPSAIVDGVVHGRVADADALLELAAGVQA